jgi:exodeoxyribonuclease-3
VRVASIYLPNGNPVGSEKFDYKLAWMDRLRRHAASLLVLEEAVALMGDYNVIPGPLDAARPEEWTSDALFQPESRAAFRSLLWLGYSEAWSEAGTGPGGYTFWDYQAGAWPRNNGIRIDHGLLSPQAADRLVSCRIDRDPRGWDKPSDHTPVVVELSL